MCSIVSIRSVKTSADLEENGSGAYPCKHPRHNASVMLMYFKHLLGTFLVVLDGC